MLRYQTSRILDPTRPFDFDGTVYRPDHFPSGGQALGTGVYGLHRESPFDRLSSIEL